jgi:hypothetical protein
MDYYPTSPEVPYGSVSAATYDLLGQIEVAGLVLVEWETALFNNLGYPAESSGVCQHVTMAASHAAG